MDAIPKAIEELMANDPDGEVEIVLRRPAPGPRREAAPADAPPEGGDAAPITALQASINRGKVEPRAPKSYAMPRRAR